jgi:hypothetical protein
MPSAQTFDDPLEGTMPLGHSDWWDALAEAATSPQQRQIVENNKIKVLSFSKSFRPNYYVSCWHMNEVENIQMWESYTKTPEAVAVATSYKTLREILPEYVEMGMVRYIDYATTELPTLNMFEYISHKNSNFSFEREIRAVAFPPVIDGLGRSHFMNNNFESESNCEFQIFAPEVNTAKLIRKVVIHPEASSKFITKIRNICHSEDLVEPLLSDFYRSLPLK